MTRYNDDYDEPYPNAGELWHANLRRALRGKRGQQALLDLYHALQALPQHRLISSSLAYGTDVCAVGALVLYRRSLAGEEAAAVLAELAGDALCTCGHAVSSHGPRGCLGCAQQNWRTVSWLAQQLDERNVWPVRRRALRPICPAFTYDEDYQESGELETAQAGVSVGTTFTLAWYLGYLNDERFGHLQPEQRWDAMVAWVVGQLQPVPV